MLVFYGKFVCRPLSVGTQRAEDIRVTWFVYVRTYCAPIATLNQNKRTRLLYLGHAQIIKFIGAQKNSVCLCRISLRLTGLLPLSYWHEFLDLVYVFKCLVSLSDPFISVMNSTRPRRTVSSKGTLLRTVFTVEPQESGILCQPTSGTLTVQWRTLRKIFLITTCISQSLFMMSTPPRPLRPIHKRGFAPGPCSRLILHVSVHTRERFQVRSICPGSLLPNI